MSPEAASSTYTCSVCGESAEAALLSHDRACGLREIHTELIDGRGARRRSRSGTRRLRHALREDARCFGANALKVYAEAFQHAGGDAFALAHQAEEQVLCADVVVVEPARFVDGQLDDLLGTRRQADLAQDGAIAAYRDALRQILT